MEEKEWQRQLARREEEKRTSLPPCFGMYAPFADRKSRNEEERAFVFALNDSPKDLTAWLVYADWLDEQDGSAQSEGSTYQEKQRGGYTDAQLAAKIRKHIEFQLEQKEQ